MWPTCCPCKGQGDQYVASVKMKLCTCVLCKGQGDPFVSVNGQCDIPAASSCCLRLVQVSRSAVVSTPRGCSVWGDWSSMMYLRCACISSPARMLPVTQPQSDDHSSPAVFCQPQCPLGCYDWTFLTTPSIERQLCLFTRCNVIEQPRSNCSKCFKWHTQWQ